MTDNSVDNNIREMLVKSASLFAEQMKLKIVENGLPNTISNAISIGEAQNMGNGKAYIDVIVDITAAPMAAAFEFGSGIHRTRGTAGEYIIAPKDAKSLVFEWPEFWESYANDPDPDVDPLFDLRRSRKFIDYRDPKFLFRWVDHPGVAARPYIVPTILSTKEKIRKFFASTIKISLLSTMTGKVEYHEDVPSLDFPGTFNRMFHTETIIGGKIGDY